LELVVRGSEKILNDASRLFDEGVIWIRVVKDYYNGEFDPGSG
jgi:hypothetical protein